MNPRKQAFSICKVRQFTIEYERQEMAEQVVKPLHIFIFNTRDQNEYRRASVNRRP